jgi:iron complex transport system ATP-binding protein
MMRLVRQIAKEEQISVAVVIHDLNLALRYCDRFLFIKDAGVYGYGGVEIMTPEAISDVYQIHVHIHDHNGVKVVIPYPDEQII